MSDATARFVGAMGAAVVPRCAACQLTADATDRCLDRTARVDDAADPVPVWLPACNWLATAATAVTREADPDLTDLIESIVELGPYLRWYRRTGLAEGPEFADGHANAIVFGPGGLVERDDVMIGLTVMAPDVVYADHHHLPEEVYLVLSPGSWRQNDGPWHEPGIGGVVYNPPDIIHSMRSGAEPLLAVWMLPSSI